MASATALMNIDIALVSRSRSSRVVSAERLLTHRAARKLTQA